MMSMFSKLRENASKIKKCDDDDKDRIERSALWKTVRWKNDCAAKGEQYCPTYVEQIANIITHGLFIPVFIFLFYNLVQSCTTSSLVWSAKVYGICTVFLLSTSTLFHAYSLCGSKSSIRNFLHRCDRTMIYVFIGGTYTPLLHLQDHGVYPELVEILRSSIWVWAFIGIAYQQLFHERFKLVETLIYVAISTLPGLVVVHMESNLQLDRMGQGGLSFILGLIFFKLDGVIPFAHAIWHLHVIVGILLQFYAMSDTLFGAV